VRLKNFYFFSYKKSFFSLSDIVNSKLGMPRPQIGQSISQQGFFSSRDSLSVPCVSQPLHSYSATTSDMDLSRKNESKSSKLKPGEQPLLGSWNPSTAPRESIAHPTATSASTNHLTSNNGNGVNSSNNADRLVQLNQI
jgi:cyclic nucleotide gated channel alpha 3